MHGTLVLHKYYVIQNCEAKITANKYLHPFEKLEGQRETTTLKKQSLKS